ncbi:hypothetical protein SRABI106_04785 [Rahnella aquatilis]|nr:hypothetical protein SRABI106_04785 [Rahnella aquatilis]
MLLAILKLTERILQFALGFESHGKHLLHIRSLFHLCFAGIYCLAVNQEGHDHSCTP